MKVKNLPVILAVDDESAVLETFKIILDGKFKVLTAANAKEALEKMTEEQVDLVLLDINMPDVDGFEILRRIKEHDVNLSVIMATATDKAKTAVEALQSGANGYITKPFDPNEVIAVIQNEIKRRELLKEVVFFRSQRQSVRFENIIGKSKQIREIYDVIEKILCNDSTVLISGESGTGKELIARAVHFNSLRQDKPFIAINCAGIPDKLLETELFGHEKGAFTDAAFQKIGMFELANEGTLLLDEISDLKVDMQAKLLRVIEEQEIKRVGGTKVIKLDVRIISATNSDLNKAMQEGKFRRDLYYRLNVVPIHIPPLRERREDVILLVEHFLKLYNKSFRKNIKGFTKDAMDSLMNYDWPGNIRELRNVIERMVALSDNDKSVIGRNELPFDIFIQGSLTEPFSPGGSLRNACDDFQKQYIEAVLEKAGGNQVKAAKMLGIHRNALFNKMKGLGLKK
ncbi:MAG: sigma-54 dependent transcriptional regulator [Candidatus Omnitrophica bacterium]|nr:sigma-54 dependent transcriptional regulator [Candidatus Omnitrophota bacterium]